MKMERTTSEEGAQAAPAPFGTYPVSPLHRWLWYYTHASIVKKRSAPSRAAQRLRRSAAKRLLPLTNVAPPFDVEPWPGVRLRLDPRDNTTDRHAMGGRPAWSEEDADALRRAIARVPDGVLHYVDVGANTGIYSAFVAGLARAADVTLRPVCIEPQPLLVDRLRTNLVFAGIDPSVVRAEGTGPVEGIVRMDVSQGRNLGKASMREARLATSDKMIEVPCRPLAAILSESGLPRVDVMKVDIEGLEVPALSSFFAEAPRELHPRTVLIEIAIDPEGSIHEMMTTNGYVRVHANPSDAIYEREDRTGGWVEQDH